MRWLGVGLLGLTAACGRGDSQELRVAGGECMGTVWTAKWFGGPPQDEGFVAIATRLDAFEDVFSTWREGSEISRFNAVRNTEPVVVSMELYGVVSRAWALADATGGAFDPTVGPYYDLYQRVRRGGEVAPAEWEAARERVGFRKLRLVPDPPEGVPRLAKANPDLVLDVSGIAKGAGCDAVAERLKELGVRAAMVEIGGEVHAFGTKPGGTKWRLGVENPGQAQTGTGEALEAVWVGGADGPFGLATSGRYRNFAAQEGGGRMHHIFDPRTAGNAQHDTVSVSVLARDCETADALATALMVMGAEEARAFHAGGTKDWSALVVEAPAEFGGEWRITRLGWE